MIFFFPPSNAHHFVSKSVCAGASFVSWACRSKPLINKTLTEPPSLWMGSPNPSHRHRDTLPGSFIPCCKPSCQHLATTRPPPNLQGAPAPPRSRGDKAHTSPNKRHRDPATYSRCVENTSWRCPETSGIRSPRAEEALLWADGFVPL